MRQTMSSIFICCWIACYLQNSNVSAERWRRRPKKWWNGIFLHPPAPHWKIVSSLLPLFSDKEYSDTTIFSFFHWKIVSSLLPLFQTRELVKQQSFPFLHEKIISLFFAFFLWKPIALLEKRPNNRRWHDVCYLSVYVIVRLRLLWQSPWTESTGDE